MRVRGLDDNGDWLFGKSTNDYRVDKDALKQNVKTRLASFLGDCFFSLSSGIDWFNLLGSKNQTGLSIAISSTLLNTKEVLRINSLAFSVDANRSVIFNYDIDTTYGTIKSKVGTSFSGQELTTEFGDFLTTEDGETLITE